MAEVPQPVLVMKPARLLLIVAVAAPLTVDARKFYDDDPLEREPPPLNVESAQPRKLNEYYDFFTHQFGPPGERPSPGNRLPAQGVNTLGEVPDGAWYVTRHYRRPLTLEELQRGPGLGETPEGDWKVVAAKTEGVSPGFTIEDENRRRFIIKFDPRRNPEMATAADVIGSRFFHALGYHVPEYYIAYFDRDRLTVAPDARITDATGKHRPMSQRDIEQLLVSVEPDPARGYRAVASRFLPGKILGPFRYHGTRRDDPNDVFRHERRRELRGLFVFAAWLGHNDVKALNTLDTLIEDNGVKYIRHYLIDFGASLGSDSFTAKSPRAGAAYMFEWGLAAKQLFSLGLFVPRWARAKYPRLPSVGNFESRLFDPDRWKPNYPIPAFENRLPEDEFWAAKQVMAFRDEEIRAIVQTGAYSDPKSEEWLTTTLIARRDKIGRTYFAKVLPLDRFRLDGDRLDFVDLEVRHGFVAPRRYRFEWFLFDNERETKTPVGQTAELPPELRRTNEGEYFGVSVSDESGSRTVTVYFRRQAGRNRVVGIEHGSESTLSSVDRSGASHTSR